MPKTATYLLLPRFWTTVSFIFAGLYTLENPTPPPIFYLMQKKIFAAQIIWASSRVRVPPNRSFHFIKKNLEKIQDEWSRKLSNKMKNISRKKTVKKNE